MRPEKTNRPTQLAEGLRQIEIIEDSRHFTSTFEDKLKSCGLHPLTPRKLEILQVNLGYLCNQTCEHCHVDAGPQRREVMSKEIQEQCLEAIDSTQLHTVDLTGGAPEMNPHFKWFVQELSKRNVKVIVRSNLTILVSNAKYKEYPQFLAKNQVEVIASLPCYTAENVDKQRGSGVFDSSVKAIKKLNDLGYGKQDSGLNLHLVFNPGGASLPARQEALETDYKRELEERFGVVFNQLYTITNLPISRFLNSLLVMGKYETYMQKLVDAFNPVAAKSVMCRNTLSVDWQGYLYDCDFNQMLGLKIEHGTPIKEFNEAKLTGRNIVVNQHCFGCTAGAGSSCQGSIT